jgi:NifB/MoaA-like Fe-S oxidoreductase
MDLERVIDQALSPLHVSIHDADPWGRAEMLRNDRGAMSLRWLRALLDQGVTVRGQVVLCPGLNDGEVLERTFAGIIDRFPELEAVAVVPLGLSRFNPESQLRVHTAEEAAAAIDLVERWRVVAGEVIGHPMFWASDELYLRSGRPMPRAEEYGEFPMYEDGVGIARCFSEEFRGRRESPLGPTSGFFASVDGASPGGYRAERMPANPAGDTGLRPVRVTLTARRSDERVSKIGILTGEYAAPLLDDLISGSFSTSERVRVLPVRNDFFGGNTAVAGLMVGADLRREIESNADIDLFLLPDVCLSEGRFLDGVTLDELPGRIEVVPTDGVALRRILERSL